jgi:hypothetical protein
MANTLTISALTENIFRARDKVARELIGFIPSVMVNSEAKGVSQGGTVKSFRTALPTLNTSHAPAMTIPAGDDQTIEGDDMTLGQVANVRIPLTGEKLQQLNNTAGGQEVIDNLFAQAFRKITNAIESHIGTVAKNGASRAVGTAGTTPFASTHNILNSARQVLSDNGCPFDGMNSLVINSLAGTNLRNLTQLTKANEAGSSDPIRRGTLLDVSGFMIKESAGVAAHTKGTAASSTTNNAGYAVGATALTLASAGTGTLVAGDCVTFAGDTTNIYVVESGDTDVSDGGVLTLNRPGVQIAMSAATKAITVGANYTGNAAFHKSAIELAMRPPAMPDGGDAAVDRLTLFDEVSGLVFEIALYKGYGMVMFDITVIYQAKVWKPEFVATLLG